MQVKVAGMFYNSNAQNGSDFFINHQCERFSAMQCFRVLMQTMDPTSSIV